MTSPDTTSTETPADTAPGAGIYLLGFFGVVIFGATLPITRFALVDFSPWFLTFARAGLAALLAILMLLAFRKPLRHPHEFQIFVAGVFLIFGFPGLMAVAMKTVPASHGGVVLGFLPLASAILARLIAGEHPSKRFWLLSITGGLLVAAFTYFKADDTGTTGISAGDLWLVLAGLCASAGYVIFGKLSRNTPGWEIISRALVLNLPIILAGIVLLWESRYLQASPTGLLAFVYLGAFSMYLGFCAWNVALALGGIARISQLQLLQTFVTLIISALLLGEAIDLATLGAAIAITVIVALSRR